MTSINSLVGDHKNARRRTDRSSLLIKQSLEKYGAARSIVIDEENRILAGNGTIEGAKAAGIKNVRIIETDGDEIIAVKRTGLSEDEKVGLALADNRTADLSEWDQEMLHQLSEEHDLSPWFEQEDLDELFNVTSEEPVEGNTDPDDVPEVPEDPITKPGDLWVLGNHRLLCGDSTNPQHVERLMDGKKAAFAIADPPYNVGYEYNKYNDNKSAIEYNDFCTAFVNNALSFAPFAVISPGKGNALHYMKMPSYIEFLTWYKKFGLSRGSCFKAMTTEPLMLHGVKPKNMFYNTDCLEIMTEREPGLRKLHSCPKPVALWEALIEPMTNKSDIVLEMFGGSGTTVIACEKTRRYARLMELDPAYCDVIVKRWEDFTGNTAICEPSAEHFQEELEVA